MKKASQAASVAFVVALAAALAAASLKVRAGGRRVAAHQSLQPLRRGCGSCRRATRPDSRSRKVRGVGSPAERRAELDEQFAIRTAEDVAKQLGEMKGVLMKAGQLVSFIFETLPEDAQAALATLQADAAPMAPSLAAAVVESELGAPPERIFLDWSDLPVAAASIGQVHRAVTPEGRRCRRQGPVPGCRRGDRERPRCRRGDVRDVLGDDAQGARRQGSRRRAPGTHARGARLRARGAQRAPSSRELFAGHPWVRVPRLVPELSTSALLTTEWVDGMSFERVPHHELDRHQAARREVLWRFAQHAVLRYGLFNGDPHPGNYKFHHDGSITFLDYGLVKRWSPGEWESLQPDARRDRRAPRSRSADARRWRRSGFLRAGHGLDAELVFDYVSSPYEPYLTDEFTFSREWMIDTIGKMFDIQGPHTRVIEQLNMPAKLRDPRPRRVGRQRHPRQARRRADRSGRCCSSTSPTASRRPTSVPPRRRGGQAHARERLARHRRVCTESATTCGHATSSSSNSSGRGCATTATGDLQRLFAEACHRHAWHAELWSQRMPAIPVEPPMVASSPHVDDLATEPDGTVRGTHYRMALTRARRRGSRASVGRIDPTLDPATARTVELVSRRRRRHPALASTTSAQDRRTVARSRSDLSHGRLDRLALRWRTA